MRASSRISGSVLARVLNHELRLLMRSRSTPLVSSLLVLVVCCAAWNGVRWTTTQRETIERVQAEDERVYAAIHARLDTLERAGNPWPPLQLAGMAWYIFQPEGAVAPAPHIDPRRPEAASSEWVGARHAVLPPVDTGALAIGQSDLHPFYTRVTIRTRPVLVQSDEIENPLNLLGGRFDLAFVLTFCWPLLVMPLLYNLLSEERENGTLALVASQPVPLRLILLMRLVVRTGLPVALAIVASVATLAVCGVPVDARTAPALAVWIAAVVATGMFWGSLAALINMTRWSAAACATVLAACWLAAVVVAPAAIGEIAAQTEVVPSRVQLVNALRLAGSLSSSEVAALVTSYYEERPSLTRTGLSADDTAIRGLAQQDEVDRRIDPILDAYRAAAARQQALVDRLRFVSPPLLVYDAVTELAGTAAARYRRFETQVDAHQRAWRDYFYPLVHARARMTHADYDQAPRFSFQDESAMARALRALTLVASVCIAAIVILIVALRRPLLDPR